ncbi:MAG: MFS transporter, partial [Actinobacteria bacterium]|nr:MFS transporter [Actinomycetota bacterium]
MIALPWLVLVRTDSPAAAGLVAALSALPGLVMAPVAGWLVDHLGRRLVSVGSDILSALSVAAIPIVASITDLTFTWIVVLAVIGATFDPAGYTAR